MAEAVAEFPNSAAGAGGVDGINENAGWQQEAAAPSKEGGMGQVRVEDFRPVSGGPGEIEEPSAGIDPGFPHPERQKAHTGFLEFLSDDFTIAGEGDDRDLPATLRELFGKQKNLPFGATNLIEGGNKHRDSINGLA